MIDRAVDDRRARDKMVMIDSLSMRAPVLEHHKSWFTLTEVKRPVVNGGEALVRVKSSGVNPLDTKIRAGNAVLTREFHFQRSS